MNFRLHGIIKMMIKNSSKMHQNISSASPVTLKMLGAPGIYLDEQPVRLSYLKAEALLYYLALTGQTHMRNSLAALFWSQKADKQARSSLRNALYVIRRTLKPASVLNIERDTVGIAGQGLSLDTTRFKAAIKDGAQVEPLAEALALWRGPLLAGVDLSDAPEFEAWLLEQRIHYETLYIQGLYQLGRLYLDQGQLAKAQQAYDKLLVVDPLHETAHQELMQIYTQQGQRAAALRQYETLRTRLKEEFGVSPAHPTQALHLEILQADELSAPPPVPPRPHPTAGFVGRRRELSSLEAAYHAVLPTGPARLVMLEGEPGIGKTRLAHEWLAGLSGARVLTTRCFEAEQAIPFQPWVDVIRAALQQTPASQLDLPDVWLTELAHLAPEIRLHRPGLELSPTIDPELTRGRIIQAVYHWLEALGARSPLCLFIDDWQWLDQASLTLLRYILHTRPTRPLPLLILGAQREATPLTGWSQFKAPLERDNLLTRIKLHRLSLPDVADLARSMALPGHFQTASFFARLLQETEGNPLFITELIHTLIHQNLQANDEWPISTTIQSVIQNRLAQLTDTTYQILTAGAVFGRPFSDAVLQQALAGVSFEATLQAIDEAVGANIIVEQDHTYDFSHDKIRTVLLDGLTQSRRRHLHLRLADALEATLSNDFGLLSYHFEMGGDFLRARNFGLRAARRAAELYADDEALEWYTKVETLLGAAPAELSPQAIPKITPFQQPHVSLTHPLDALGFIQRQRGIIYQRTGQYTQAYASFQAALARGEQRQRFDEQAAAHNLLSFLAYLRSDYDGVRYHAEQGLHLASQTGDPTLRAPGLRHLGIAVYRTGNYARARQLYDEALNAYRQADDQLGMAGVYNNIGFVLRTQSRYPEAIAAFEKALALYDALGQIEGIALIHSNVGRTYAFSGNLSQAKEHLQHGLALSEEARTDWITVKIHRTLGSVFAQNQHWPEALDHAQQARVLADTLGSTEDLGATFRLLAEIAAAWPVGNLGDPADYFEQGVALLERVGAKDELERVQNSYRRYQAGR